MGSLLLATLIHLDQMPKIHQKDIAGLWCVGLLASWLSIKVVLWYLDECSCWMWVKTPSKSSWCLARWFAALSLSCTLSVKMVRSRVSALISACRAADF